MPRSEHFGRLQTGQAVERHWLEHGHLRVAVLTYGATIQDLRLAGFDHPLVLGAHRLQAYEGAMAYFGAIVGRVANRIGRAEAMIAGRHYRLDRNYLDKHLLHGGTDGCHRQLWQITAADATQMRLHLTLPHGHMGFPGTLDIDLCYRIMAPATLELEIEARTDAPTLCNLAPHSYFNLDGSPDIFEHRLQVSAQHYLALDDEQIPTGQMLPVQGTALDFNRMRALRRDDSYPGYDHNLCLSQAPEPLRRVASLFGPRSGISLHLETTEPGLQIYDGRHIAAPADSTLNSAPYGAHAGIALEPQRWPDAAHHPHFPSTLLRPSEVYRQTTRWVFEAPQT